MANAADSDGRYLKDGVLSFIGGVDASVPASDISRNQVAGAINAMFRQGAASPRYGFKKKPLAFAPGVQQAFQQSLFQHGSFYSDSTSPCLLSSHGGRMFRVDPETWMVSEITPIKPATTQTVGAFTVPAAGDTTNLQLDSAAGMFAALNSLTAGGYALQLVSVDSDIQVTVKNIVPDQSFKPVADGSAVVFTTYDTNSPVLPLAWSAQPQNYWVLQDNQSYAFIWDGSASRRADPSNNEVPVGNVMAEAMGRLLVALPERSTYRVGNLIFGDGTLSNILRFDENNYLNEGGDFTARVFGAPSNAGEIRAICAGAMTDTQLGQGPGQVGAPRMIFTVSLPFDRTTWKNSSNILQTANPIEGPLGQCLVAQHNSDLYYRSIDGVRSYIQAQRQFNTEGNTPVSGEVNNVLSHDTQSLLEHGSMVVFDNLLLMTISPARSQRGVWHRGLMVRDFEPESATRRDLGAIWNGVWTGVRVLKIVAGLINGEERCFLYVLSDSQDIELWEIEKDATEDEGGAAIAGTIDLPSFNCGDSDRFKQLQTGRFIISDLGGKLDLTIKYQTDLSPCFQPWDSLSVCAQMKDCSTPQCSGPHNYQKQQRTPIKLRLPPDGFDPVSGIKHRTGYEFQPRIEFSSVGGFILRQFRIYALDTPESLSRERSAAESVINVPPAALVDASGNLMLDALGKIMLAAG